MIHRDARVWNIASLQPHFHQTNPGLHSPVPVKKEIGRYPRVAYLREALQCLGVSPPREFRIAGRDHADGCPWHSVLFRVAAHRSSAQSHNPFEIEAERPQPSFSENEDPRTFAIFLTN